MEKKRYIAPQTDASLLAVESNILGTSYEHGGSPSDSDAKENSDFIWDENPDDPFNEDGNPFDLWGE